MDPVDRALEQARRTMDAQRLRMHVEQQQRMRQLDLQRQQNSERLRQEQARRQLNARLQQHAQQAPLRQAMNLTGTAIGLGANHIANPYVSAIASVTGGLLVKASTSSWPNR